MGGDFGPKTTIEGVAMASKIHPNVKFKLFGDKDKSNNDLVKTLNLRTLNFFTPMKVLNLTMNQLMHSEN